MSETARVGWIERRKLVLSSRVQLLRLIALAPRSLVVAAIVSALLAGVLPVLLIIAGGLLSGRIEDALGSRRADALDLVYPAFVLVVGLFLIDENVDLDDRVVEVERSCRQGSPNDLELVVRLRRATEPASRGAVRDPEVPRRTALVEDGASHVPRAGLLLYHPEDPDLGIAPASSCASATTCRREPRDA